MAIDVKENRPTRAGYLCTARHFFVNNGIEIILHVLLNLLDLQLCLVIVKSFVPSWSVDQCEDV